MWKEPGCLRDIWAVTRICWELGCSLSERREIEKEVAAWSLRTRKSVCGCSPLSKRSEAGPDHWDLWTALRKPEWAGLLCCFISKMCSPWLPQGSSQLEPFFHEQWKLCPDFPWRGAEGLRDILRHSVIHFSQSKVRNISTKLAVRFYRAINYIFFGSFARNAYDSRIFCSYSLPLTHSKIQFQFLMLSWVVFMASLLEKNENECTKWKTRQDLFLTGIPCSSFQSKNNHHHNKTF